MPPAPSVAAPTLRTGTTPVHYRDLVGVLLEKELKVRYRSTLLGYLWSILHPLAFALVFYLVFKWVVRIEVEHYALFLITGLFPWQWFQNGLTASSRTFLHNADLIRKVRFPRWTLALAAALNDMAHFALAIPVIVVFMALAGLAPGWSWLVWLPLLAACQLVLALGLGLLIASVNLFLRDLERLVTVVAQLWFYATPVVYPITMVPEPYRFLLWCNPMASLVLCWRGVFLEGQPPAGALALAAAWSVALLAVGAQTYRRTCARFAELV